MKQILNYYCTTHFTERTNQRGIDSFLVSLCLTKGEKIKEDKKKKRFILKKEKIIDAIKQGYINANDYLCLDTLTIITKDNQLITVFTRYSDLGIKN